MNEIYENNEKKSLWRCFVEGFAYGHGMGWGVYAGLFTFLINWIFIKPVKFIFGGLRSKIKTEKVTWLDAD